MFLSAGGCCWGSSLRVLAASVLLMALLRDRQLRGGGGARRRGGCVGLGQVGLVDVVKDSKPLGLLSVCAACTAPGRASALLA